jgi:hypothetical protein
MQMKKPEGTQEGTQESAQEQQQTPTAEYNHSVALTNLLKKTTDLLKKQPRLGTGSVAQMLSSVNISELASTVQLVFESPGELFFDFQSYACNTVCFI